MLLIELVGFFTLVILFGSSADSAAPQFTGRYDNYENHPCIRDCSASASAMICEYDWTVETFATLSRYCYACTTNITDCYREMCIVGDGTARTVEVVNRLLPGPTIQVCQGDTIVVNLLNELHSEKVTSIHWHGIEQRGTPNMDGVGYITQSPVMPHSNFTYRFKADDPGTHIWHAHSGTQRADGVFGSLIVRQPKQSDGHGKLYDYDLKDHIIILNDWNKQLFDTSLTPNLYSDLYKDIDSILINGKGKSKLTDKMNIPLATFTVKRNVRYRFRLINAGINFCPIMFSIDKHNLTLIATDGSSIDPLQVESLVTSSGERYDFILDTTTTAANGNNDNAEFLIRARGEGYCGNKEIFQIGLLRYESNNNKVRSSSTPTLNNVDFSKYDVHFNETNRNGPAFRSVTSKEDNRRDYVSINQARSAAKLVNSEMMQRLLKPKPDKKFYLTVDLEQINHPLYNNIELYPDAIRSYYSPQINRITFKMPSTVLLNDWNKIPRNEFCNEETRNLSCPVGGGEFCWCIHTIEVNYNDVVEFVLVDEAIAFEMHPMHLHGNSFAFLGSEKLNDDANDIFGIKNLLTETVKKMDEKGQLKRNFDRPIMKDTIAVPTSGYAIIRFIADNPGLWFFHCHLETHSGPGMGLIVKVGNETTTTQLKKKKNNIFSTN